MDPSFNSLFNGNAAGMKNMMGVFEILFLPFTILWKANRFLYALGYFIFEKIDR